MSRGLGDVYKRQELGCGAFLKGLRRTHSGNFDLERSLKFEELKHGDRANVVAKMLSLPEVSRLRGA